jgi:flagellar protein FlbD
MIELTKLNRSKLVINSDLIEFIESAPDSLITLTTGKKIMVQETIAQIVEAVVHFRQLVRSSETGARASLPLEASKE